MRKPPIKIVYELVQSGKVVDDSIEYFDDARRKAGLLFSQYKRLVTVMRVYKEVSKPDRKEFSCVVPYQKLG